MYLIDTNVISELRKKTRINHGVLSFFQQTKEKDSRLYLSSITIGELRRGVDMIFHRGDSQQAEKLQHWLERLLIEFSDSILDFSHSEALIWGRLRVPNHENAIDKQIAATALSYNLTLVTRNTADFKNTGVKLLNPFN